MIPHAHSLPNGMVIMFEGIDGVGKTTQLELVRDALTESGWPVLATRNLGGTPIGEALREVIKSPLERPPLTDFYVSLAIQEPLIGVVDVARAAGKIVLMDRGPLSLAAYQIYGAGIDESVGWRHVESGMDRLKPDAIVIYDMDARAAIGRKRELSDKADYFESKPPDYFKKVAAGYHATAKRYPGTAIINAAGSIGNIHEQTMAVIAPLLK